LAANGSSSTMSTGTHGTAVGGFPPNGDVSTARAAHAGRTAHGLGAPPGRLSAGAAHTGLRVVILTPIADAFGLSRVVDTDFTGRTLYVEAGIIDASTCDALEARGAHDTGAFSTARPISTGGVLRTLHVEAWVRHALSGDTAVVQRA